MSQAPFHKLSPEKALIFRVTHIRNIPWALRHGLCASLHDEQDPDFVSIGLGELIQARRRRKIPIDPGGSLADYVPFYFTPYSPMLYNIVTGRNVERRPRRELAVLVSSLRRAVELERPFVVSDRHAYLSNARFTNEISRLSEWVPWSLLRGRDFKREPENPEKTERYQAEALIYRHLPAHALDGVVVYNEEAEEWVARYADEAEVSPRIVVRPGWFF